jgi:protein-tyrosine phosphatase
VALEAAAYGSRGSAPRFAKVYNFRDLGGHLTTAGVALRHGVLYRSAELTNATIADAEEITCQLGIRSVIDLRTAAERERFGSVGPWARRIVNFSLFDDSTIVQTFPTLGSAYVGLLERREVGERLVEVLSMLVREGALPAIFCCSAGKDRTGLVASAVLASVGVGDQVIVEDYAASDESLGELYATWAKHPASNIETLQQTIPHLLGAPRDAMEHLLLTVRHGWGSLRSYLEEHGAPRRLFSELEWALLAT